MKLKVHGSFESKFWGSGGMVLVKEGKKLHDRDHQFEHWM
jgi:hypothetical protein